MNSDNQNFHWAEGFKFAHESVKLVFLINGASAVSLLTFMGNQGIGSARLVCALLSFAFGAALAVGTMACAYLAQLHYGKAEKYKADPKSYEKSWESGLKWHRRAYWPVIGSMALFVFGTLLAGWAIYSRFAAAD